MTLLETLVAVAVLAILIGLVVVAVGGARVAAGETGSLANLRGVGVTLNLYASAHDDRHMFVGPDEAVWSAPPGEGFRGSFSPVWWLDRMWPTLMHDVAPWPEHFETWLSPGSDREPPYWPIGIGLNSRPVSYEYANAYLGAPVIWSGSGVATRDDIRPTRTSDVAFPSAKVVMFDIERAYLRDGRAEVDRRPVLMSDGSASVRLDGESAEPVVNPFYSVSPRRYHDTPGGIAGRDF